ncbi:MAG TPA: hypothetical protein VJJ98_06275, partial [Sedimentisphaerales bacterium]|nr:hypothetical protein [Sedimentisphaerales bacterium]
MAAEKRLQEMEQLLRKHSQSHLLAFWADLNPGQRDSLLGQLNALDWSKIDAWVAKYVKKAASG